MHAYPIRLATTVDVPLIAQCAREAYAMYIDRMGREPAPMVADFATAVRNGTVCVAGEGSQLAGYVVFYPQDDHLHLENIAVRSQFQGQGIGRQLLHHVEDAARQRGCVAVELYTNAKMFENLAMYPKFGYVQTERRIEDGFDRVFFCKML
ncbi:MAG: ribosomal protein S18 acetylase RimI-like enzyme [Gammaproteobacteria bacterium]